MEAILGSAAQVDDRKFRKELYGAVLRRKWEKVVELYKKFPEKHNTKITNTEDTALHVAITQGAPEEVVVKLVDEINKTARERAKETLTARNNREDTPLHCAASRGSRRICERIVLLDASLEIGDALVRMLNKEGESPLFLAALHGHKNTFLYLHAVCTKGGYMNSALWTKHGGDTILHFTIQRQYFDLSLLIIHLYKDQQLASKVNDEGVTHLQVLASIPTAFKSGTRLRWREKFLYTYTHVEPLKFDHVQLDIDHSEKHDNSDSPTHRYKSRGIRRIKEKHVWGGEIMEELVKQSSEYEYIEKELFHDLSEMMELEAMMMGDHMQMIPESEENRATSVLIIATRYGLIELVEKILAYFPVAIHDKTKDNNRNVVHVAAESRQPHILELLMKNSLWHNLVEAVDDEGNNALHLAATLPEHMPWEIHGSAMQMQWEVKWFQYVKENMPPYLNSQRNKAGHTPEEIFAEHHKDLVKQGNKWLKDTSSSYSIVAALTAGVTYSTSYTVPGGNDQDNGKPIFQGQPAFTLFAISALISFCLSVSSLAAFLAIYSSRMQPRDFQRSLPLKLLFGLTSFFICVITMLVSFCAAHSFELGSYNNGSEHKVIAWYGITLLPLCFYSAAQVPLYWDLLRASLTTVPKPNQVGEDVPI